MTLDVTYRALLRGERVGDGFVVAAHPEEEVYVCRLAPFDHAVSR